MKGFTKSGIVFIFLSRFRTSDVMFNYVRKYVAKQYTVYYGRFQQQVLVHGMEKKYKFVKI